jgi:hypothetical protein
MNYDTDELKITLYTNIQNNRLIVLTRKLLSHPELSSTNIDLNDYPYFTFDVKYPADNMRYLTYQERVEIFFNKQQFIEYLFAYSTEILGSKDNEEYYSKRDKFIEHNITTMIEILFPTKFPVINDIHTSYDKLIGKSSISRMILNPIITKYFSYLNIGGNTYTFKKNIWLNDFLNNPLYRKLLEDYRKFWVWSKEEKARWITIIDKEIGNNIKNLKIIIDEFDKIFEKQPIITEDPDKEVPSTVLKTYVCYKYLYNYYLDYLKTDNQSFDSKKNINDIINNLTINKLKQPDKISGGAGIREKKEKTIKERVETNGNFEDFFKIINVKIKKEDMDIVDKIELLFIIVNYFKKKQWLKLSKSKKFEHEKDIYEINKLSELVTSTSRFNNAYGYYKQVLDMYKVPYEKLRNEKYYKLESFGSDNLIQNNNIQLPAEYKNFAYNTLTLYKRPQRESTNANLQNLINSFESETTKEFYIFLDKVYNFYMRSSKDNLSDEEIKLLDVGLNYINTNITEKGLRREIYIMTDFIEGIVDDKNVNNIYCPFISEHLGNEFQFLVRMTQGGKLNKMDINSWAVDRNRMIFSLKTLKNNNVQELKVTEMKPDMFYQNNISSNKKNIEMLPFNYDEQKNKQESDDVVGMNSWFFNEIISNNQKDFEEIINEINYYGITNIVLTELFDVIKKNTELYDIIKKWHSSKYKYSSTLMSSMIMLSSNYDGKIKDINNKINEQKNKLNTEALNNLNYQLKVYTLLKMVVDKLMINENKKNQLITNTLVGGKNISKKNKKYEFNNTRKNIY